MTRFASKAPTPRRNPQRDAEGVAQGERAGGLRLEADDSFVTTPAVERITRRALAYLDAGYPVHLSGPAGTGKTTLAFHIASARGRPVALVHGNDAFGGSDLMGQERGYTRSSVVDNYIHSVVKTQERLERSWSDNRVTVACEHGHTLIYDEFNRTRAEANNVLLSILEEGIISVPSRGDGYLRVHPEFRVVLTSNPAEYAGTHRAQDALMDRLITIRCDHYDGPTETRIVAAASGCLERDASAIVGLVRALRGERGENARPTIRAAIALARVTAQAMIEPDPTDETFALMAWDLLGQDAQSVAGAGPLSFEEFRGLLLGLLAPPAPAVQSAAARPGASRAA